MRVPFGVYSIGLLRARPVSPLEYGMIGPHDASCAMSADVLCHNPPKTSKTLSEKRILGRLWRIVTLKREQGSVSEHRSGVSLFRCAQ